MNGDCLRFVPLEGGLVELCFERSGGSVNKLDDLALAEFGRAVERLAGDPAVRGVLLTSAKDSFIVGADIMGFAALFRRGADEVARGVRDTHRLFCAFEDLPVPTVAAIDGAALGGGLELALCASMRVTSERATLGLPEVKLGLFPGFGGTVRLPRVAGQALAIDWVGGGRASSAEQALAGGVVDAVVPAATLRAEALAMLARCVEGQVDWRAAQERKRRPIAAEDELAVPLYEQALQRLASQAARHQPAAAVALETMREAARHERAAALELEAVAFGRITQTQAARSMVQTFLNEQVVAKAARRGALGARPVRRAAVIGAGIMGGGIACTSALRGTPVHMKDIAAPALELGMAEARRQVERQRKQGRIAPEHAEAVLAAITPQLDDEGLDRVDLVVEAVVESLAVKHRVLAALEGAVSPGTVIASNTSSLRIDDIAAPLARPQDVVGMHFFNPVPAMPLVEVVRGSRSSDAAVATATAYAMSLGKTPVVVADCPGFLVNRILTPYIVAFCDLVAEGADFERVDRALEAFGWPMGPAWLEDVVGMDTGSHVIDTIAAGYPQRIRPPARNAIAELVRHGRLGQKSGGGFYDHDTSSGKPRRTASPAARALIATLQQHTRAGAEPLDDAAMVERMMVPMLLEAVRALEEGVVGTPAELDMAMLLGVGFPPYLGGPLQYADRLGASHLIARCDALSAHGPAYEAPALLRDMAASGRTFHPA
ncbi:MAG: fatty acid oxidation complex subunit alpha FadB [Comamonadaceae bacterium]|nr:MAG: fatty acid oxidation complex subunit alpha FadB [Comamonadaceae bacterium]